MPDPSADLQLCFHLFSKRLEEGGAGGVSCTENTSCVMSCSGVSLGTETCCRAPLGLYSHTVYHFSHAERILLFELTRYFVHLNSGDGTLLYYRFGVEAVSNSFGACFEGPVVVFWRTTVQTGDRQDGVTL